MKALLFYHQKQIEDLNLKVSQKTSKLNMLREEYDEVLENYKECALARKPRFGVSLENGQSQVGNAAESLGGDVAK